MCRRSLRLALPAALAAVASTRTIPIAFISSVDPVKVGLVESFNRPGGNATGVAFLDSELVGKQFELVRELLPKAAMAGFLVNPKSANAETQLAAAMDTKQALGLEIVVQNASTERDVEAAFVAFAQRRVAAFVVGSDPFFYSERALIAALAAQHSLPAIYYDREYIAAGGLISYGASVTDAYRQAGVFTGRFLKGDKPADLPVQQAVKVELIVNLKTAKARSASKCRCHYSCASMRQLNNPALCILAAQRAFMPAAQRQMIRKRQRIKDCDPGDRQQ
jgi:ABC-type uncharacterized transport system substrate-binding protein